MAHEMGRSHVTSQSHVGSSDYSAFSVHMCFGDNSDEPKPAEAFRCLFNFSFFFSYASRFIFFPFYFRLINVKLHYYCVA